MNRKELKRYFTLLFLSISVTNVCVLATTVAFAQDVPVMRPPIGAWCARLLAPIFVSRASIEKNKISLMNMGYEELVAEKIVKIRPDIVGAILNSGQGNPRIVFRGLECGLNQYDPKFNPSKNNKNSNQARGDRASPWFSTSIEKAFKYSIKRGVNADGIVIAYQIPEFMVQYFERSKSDVGSPSDTKTKGVWSHLPEGEDAGQIPRDWLGTDETPFVSRIAVLNGSPIAGMDRMPIFEADTPLAHPKYIKHWVRFSNNSEP